MRRWNRSLRDRIAGILFVVLVVTTAVIVVWTMRQGYAVYKLTRGVGDTWFLAADGRQWFRMDEQRRDVPLADIPPDLQHAFIAIEDHRFYHHIGVDPIALARAVYRNLREPGTVEGGSTLTQQLARTLFLSNKKSYGRKLREAVLAVMIDAQLSKEQVLELYLNRIYLSAGVYGVETMSRHLFGKPAKQLNLAECALIAGLARAPASLSPWTHPEAAVARSHVVLTRMREEKFITADQEEAARRTRIRIRPFPSAVEARAATPKSTCVSCFAIGSAAITRPIGKCGRPLSRHCRKRPSAPSATVCSGSVIRSCKRRWWRSIRAPATSSRWSAAVTSASRSSIGRAAAGVNPDPPSSRSCMRPRSSTASPRCRCSPISTAIAPQGPDEWAPRNANGEDAPALTLRAALIESDNRAATALQQRIGSRPVLRLASDVGLHNLPDVPSLSLGTGLVTPLDLTAAFAEFPEWRLRRAAARDRARARCRWRHRLRQPGCDVGVSSHRRWRIRWSRC